MAGEMFEELIYEMYLMKGYLCLRNIPGKPLKKGGRDEYDLIALKFDNNKIKEIVWVEVTTYLSGGMATIENKFDLKKVRGKEDYIVDYLKHIYSIDINKRIFKIMYTMHEHPNIQREINSETGNGLRMYNRIQIIEEIRKAISDYKEIYTSKKLAGSKTNRDNIALPESFRTLKTSVLFLGKKWWDAH